MRRDQESPSLFNNSVDILRGPLLIQRLVQGDLGVIDGLAENGVISADHFFDQAPAVVIEVLHADEVVHSHAIIPEKSFGLLHLVGRRIGAHTIAGDIALYSHGRQLCYSLVELVIVHGQFGLLDIGHLTEGVQSLDVPLVLLDDVGQVGCASLGVTQVLVGLGVCLRCFHERSYLEGFEAHPVLVSPSSVLSLEKGLEICCDRLSCLQDGFVKCWIRRKYFFGLVDEIDDEFKLSWQFVDEDRLLWLSGGG